MHQDALDANLARLRRALTWHIEAGQVSGSGPLPSSAAFRTTDHQDQVDFHQEKPVLEHGGPSEAGTIVSPDVQHRHDGLARLGKLFRLLFHPRG